MTNTITVPLRQAQGDIILKNRSEYVMVSLSKGDIIEKKTL